MSDDKLCDAEDVGAILMNNIIKVPQHFLDFSLLPMNKNILLHTFRLIPYIELICCVSRTRSGLVSSNSV